MPILLPSRQNAGPVVEAAAGMRKAGVLRRAVYHDVADHADKNLRECVRRVDGHDAVNGNRDRRGFLVLMIVK